MRKENKHDLYKFSKSYKYKLLKKRKNFAKNLTSISFKKKKKKNFAKRTSTKRFINIKKDFEFCVKDVS